MTEIEFSLSPLIEVVGWFVLAALQIFVLVRQAELNKRVEGFRLRTSRTVSQLQDFIDWITKGHKLASYFATLSMRLSWAGDIDSAEEREFSKRINQIDKDRLEWDLSFYYYAGMAMAVWDPRFKGNSFGELTRLNGYFDLAFRVPTDEYQHVHSPENIPEAIRELNISYARLLAILEDYVQKSTE